LRRSHRLSCRRIDVLNGVREGSIRLHQASCSVRNAWCSRREALRGTRGGWFRRQNACYGLRDGSISRGEPPFGRIRSDFSRRETWIPVRNTFPRDGKA
jgi:hypothetical protein